MSTNSQYFSHIDGLRAFAVLSVILFHFDFSSVSGGFVGVDIFFVISGFLITRLIISELEQTNHFNFKNFYLRRVRRLFPALIVVLTLSTVAASILLTPETLAEFGRSLSASALSISNILFWRESGYFESPAQLKPLLHTWSLSVEEQFYLFWPITLYVIWAVKTYWTRIILIAFIGMASFILNCILIYSGRADAAQTIFFLAPFRIFEFIIGAMGVLLINRQFLAKQYIQEILCLVGILICAFSITAEYQQSTFPYIYALPSCIGALLIIIASNSYLGSVVFSNRASVFFGLISYSLYLVHWPILVFSKYLLLTISSKIYTLVMLIVSALLAFFIYQYIERPFRNPKHISTKTKVHAVSLIILGILFVVGLSMHYSDGWIWNQKSRNEVGVNEVERIGEMLSVSQINAGKSKRYKDLHTACSILTLDDENRCHMKRPIQILVFGNSHEPDGFNMLMRLYENNSKVNIINFGTTNNCNVSIGDSDFYSAIDDLECKKRFSILSDKSFLSKITHIFHNTHHGFEYFAKGMWEIMRIVQQKNPDIKIISTGSYIATSMECATLKNKFGSFDACKEKDVVDYYNPDEKKNSKIQEVRSLEYLYINKYALLCKNNKLESCVTHIGNIPMFYDQHHLSYEFARYLGELMGVHYKKELMDVGLPDPLP